MDILLLDNHDSFTWNLQHLLVQHARVEVVRNDAITVEEALRFERIVLSPGPGLPSEAGIMMAILEHAPPAHVILGVCLGMQAIVEVYGGSLYNQPVVRHGVAVECFVEDPTEPIFQGLPTRFEVGLYHSWAADPLRLPSDLKVTARSEEGVVMAVRHVERPVRGVQFHPESVLTPNGHAIIANWVRT